MKIQVVLEIELKDNVAQAQAQPLAVVVNDLDGQLQADSGCLYNYADVRICSATTLLEVK